MSDVFLTSDLHFCHNQEFLYKPRGFNSVDEMNEAIVERWNSVVKPDDMVFVLGDFMLNDNEKGIEYIKRLNGWLLAVWGNHDSVARQEFIYGHHPIIMNMGYAHQFKHNKLTCYLSHYPTLTANYDEKHFNQHVINFHGHTHQQTNWLNPANPFMYHVGLDSHNCTPVHIEEAISDIRNRWNAIGTLPTATKPEDLYPYGVI
jgi:calcineurin-like phosphoesterase family protein